MADSDETIRLEKGDSKDTMGNVFDDFNIEDLAAEEEPPEIGTREAIHQIAASAFDDLKEPRNIARLAAVATQRALPTEYGYAQDLLGQATRTGANLYNNAADNLKKPVKDLRKTVAEGLDGLKGIMSEEQINRLNSYIRPSEENDEQGPEETISRDQVALDRTLNEVFKTQTKQALVDSSRAEQETAFQKSSIDSSKATNRSLEQLVSYNDQITYRWQYQTLKLQHQQYFVARDQLDLFKAYAEDNRVRLDSIIHNTGLPDSIKRQASEEFGTLQRQRFYNVAADTVNSRLSDFGRRIGERLEYQGNNITSKLGRGLSSMTMGAAALNGMHMSSMTQLGVAGSILADLLGTSGAGLVGRQINRRTRNSPRVNRLKDRISYLWENSPELFNEFATGNRNVIPSALKSRLGVRGEMADNSLRQLIREIIQPARNNSYQAKIGLTGETALEEHPFDARDSQALRVEIPGLLSRQLQVLQSMATGKPQERTVFDPGKGTFTSESENVRSVSQQITGVNFNRQQKRLLDALTKVLTAGSENVMSPEATKALHDAFLQDSLNGKAFRLDRYAGRDYGNERYNKEIQASINTTSNSARRHTAGARVARRLRESDETVRRNLETQQALGQNEALSRLGLTDYDTANASMLNLLAGRIPNVEPQPFNATAAASSFRPVSEPEPQVQPQVQPQVRPQVQPDIRKTAQAAQTLTIEELHDTFFKTYNRQSGIPVYVLNQPEAVAPETTQPEPEAPINPIHQNPIFDLVRGGFNQVTRRLDDLIQIGDGILGGNERSDTASTRRGGPRFTQRVRNVLNPSRLRERVQSRLSRLNPFGRRRPKRYDIYVVGMQDAILTKAGFELGEYFDQRTQKPIAYPKDIKGPVRDSRGNTVLDETMVDRGLIDSEGHPLNDIVKAFHSGIEKTERRKQSLARRALGLVGRGIRGIWNLNKRTTGLSFRGLGFLGRLGLGGAKKVYDIFVRGFREPRLTAVGILNGEYIDKNTGKVIRSIEDITGPVLDQDGNEVLSARDARRGLYDSKGAPLLKLAKILMAPVNASVKAQTFLIKSIVNIPSALLNRPKNRAVDVFTRGDEHPKLLAAFMRAGRYINVEDNSPVRKPADIKGEVFDTKTQEIVLTEEDIRNGLVDIHGKPIDLKSSVVGKLIKKGAHLVGGIAKFAVKSQLAAINATKDLMSAGLSGLAGLLPWGNGAGSKKRSKHNLDDILEYMQKRWPMPKKTFGDSDDDGVRDNSWRDIFGRKGRVYKDQAPDLEKDTETKDKKEKSTGILGSIFKWLTGGIGGLVTKIVSPIKKIAEIVAAWFSWSKATDTGNAVEDAVEDVAGGRKGGKVGRMGRILRGAKSLLGKGWKFGKGAVGLVGKVAAGVAGSGLISGAASAAGTAATATASAVGTAATSVAGGVASAIGGLFSLPVLAIGAAVGGLAYGGYKLYKYEHRRRDVQPIEQLRFMMYGFKPTVEDHVVKLRYLEEEMDDHVKGDGENLTFDLKIEEVVKKFGPDFGVNVRHAAENRWFAAWFAKRFFPVYMVSRGQLNAIQKGVDLDEVDKKLDDKTKAAYIRAVTSSRHYPKGLPWLLTANPVAGMTIDATYNDVTNYIKELLTKYDKDGKSSDKPVPGKDQPKKEQDQTQADHESTQRRQSHQDNLAKQGQRNAQSAFALQKNQTMPTAVAAPEGTAQDEDQRHGMSTSRTIAPRGSTKAAAGSLRLVLPVSNPITSPYGKRSDPFKKTRSEFHKGVDFGSPIGTPVHVGADGVIYRIYRSKSYGNVIYVKHHNGMATRYAHLSGFAKGMAINTKVKQGEVIGYTGSTGHSTGPHLHWELRLNTDQWGPTDDPMKYVAATQKRDAEKEVKAFQKGDEAKQSDLEGVDTVAADAAKTTADNPAQVKRNDPTENLTAQTMVHVARQNQVNHSSAQKALTKQYEAQRASEKAAVRQRDEMITQLTNIYGELKSIHTTTKTKVKETTNGTDESTTKLIQAMNSLTSQLSTMKLPSSTSSSSTDTSGSQTSNSMATPNKVTPVVSMTD